MEENETPKTYGKIIFPGYDNNVIENPDTIAFIEVCNHCIFITFVDGSDMTQAVSLGYMEERLDPAKFFRCDHPWLVNGNFICSLKRNGRGLWAIPEKGKKIPVSVRKKDKFLVFIIRFFRYS